MMAGRKPVVPAEAGTQGAVLDSRFRGNDGALLKAD